MSNAHTWTAASSAIPCPYCSCLASRSHQLKCPKRPMTCELCQKKTLTAASMAVHLSSECPMRRSPCPGCGEHVLTDALQAHIMGGTCLARTYTCRTCESVFWIGEEYIRHALPRCAKSVVACQLCGQSVSTQFLAEHYQMCASSALSNRDRGRPSTSPSNSPPLSSPHEEPLWHTVAGVPQYRDDDEQDKQQLHRQQSRDNSRSDSHTPRRFSLDMVTTAPPGIQAIRQSGVASRSPLRVSPALLRATLQRSSSPRAIIPLVSRSPKRNLVQHDVVFGTTPRSSSARVHHSPTPIRGHSPALLREVTPTATARRSSSAQSSATPQRRSSGAVSPHEDELSGTQECHQNDDTRPSPSNSKGDRSTTPNNSRSKQRTSSPGGTSYQTRSSLLRMSASQVRINGGSTSLAAKDERQQALSEQIRRKEHEHHVTRQLPSRSPVLPACITQPLSSRPLRK
ncbi:Hypothetical protein, putative [Bodo saltans]|uniref:TRAF-type domain-containing protein n=1 Tax=Bodo saltans TaxID=75058 RepID=A0A0S4KHS8_BODSA|nr:Hypothetical protein, putative [Bodo saltans]|eukprot:CUI11166.1 Hypothetical protein, putative [Bodo saltans]